MKFESTTVFMDLSKLSGILFLLLSISVSLQAQDVKTDSTDLIIDRLFASMNIEKSAYEVPRRLEGQLRQNPFSLPEEINQLVIEDFAEAFNPDSISFFVENFFKENIAKQKARSVLQWTQKDTIQRILALEQNFESLQGFRKRVIGMYELEQNPPPETRKLMMEDLSNAKSAISEGVEQYGVIFRSFLEYINLMSTERNFSAPQIDNFVDNYKTRLRSDLDDRVTEEYLVMYYEVSQPAMENYVSFYESDPGQWYQKTYNNAVLEAYQRAADKFVAKAGTKTDSN